MRVAIETLGCKVNQSESAALEASLRDKGHQIVGKNDSPDICVINTCSVTAKSDYQSRQLMRRAVRAGARVIATGCYAQLRPGEISQIEGVDLIIGNSHKERLTEYIGHMPSIGTDTPVHIQAPDHPLVSRPYYSDRARAFLKIQDGCNFCCAYCTVPRARGKSRSLDPVEVMNAVKRLSVAGFKEIVLTGIHIGSYGLDLKVRTSLFDIVKQITTEASEARIRLSSIEPHELDMRFIDLIRDGKLCPHLHIPLQSGSDAILGKMKRGYTVSYFEGIIEQITSICPDISIGTDMIVGFPGEEDVDFLKSMHYLEKMPFSYIHVFPYSKRPGTEAESLPRHVDNLLKKERMNIALEISKKKKLTYISKQLGSLLDIIVENNTVTNGYYRAISGNYIRPLVKSDLLRSGQRLQVVAVSMDSGELLCIPA